MQASLALASRLRRDDILAPLSIFSLGIVVSWLCRVHPAMLPPWAPWDFSWTEYLAATFSLWWYGRGLMHTLPALAPPLWRRVLFLLGVALIYAVLQTHFEYLSQHMFFLNRVQHLVMHHVGPFLLALAWPGATIKRGMPAPLRRVVENRIILRIINWLQQPILAAVLFVGLLDLWLIPPVHFRAMIDPRLYAVMNWSMVIDGILFWCLVLDPRPKPPARLSFSVRILLAVSVQLPQIAVGALIGFTGHDLYSYYNLCGRVFPAIDANLDQQIGGFMVWFLGGMMSAIAVLILFHAIWVDEEKAAIPLGSITRSPSPATQPTLD